MNTFLITTYHNRNTRWSRLKDELADEEFIPVLATDYRVFLHTGLTETQAKHQSLSLAYLTICHMALFAELDEVMIFEDDVKILDSDALFQLDPPKDFDVCYLTRTPHNAAGAIYKPHNEQWDKIVGNWWETPATLWSKRFCKEFIHFINDKLSEGIWLGHIDHILVQLNKTGRFKMYGSKVETVKGLSNIDQNEMSKEDKCIMLNTNIV